MVKSEKRYEYKFEKNCDENETTEGEKKLKRRRDKTEEDKNAINQITTPKKQRVEGKNRTMQIFHRTVSLNSDIAQRRKMHK